MLKHLSGIENIKYLDSTNFFLIAGPCVIESEAIVFKTAEELIRISNKYRIPLIFKSSYRKANRSRIDSFTGIGDTEALSMLKRVKKEFGVPVLTDIHSHCETKFAADFVDVLQIPAFLCRQTELLVAAAQTGRYVNIKKGQFLSPSSMKYATQKVIDTGNKNVMITDRGTMFGYQDLIVDFRGIPLMQKETGLPVILDITHSLQQPNQESGVSGGKPELIETIAKAGIAVGVDGIFIETHPDPSKAKSDGSNMLKLDLLENLVAKLVKLKQTVNDLNSI